MRHLDKLYKWVMDRSDRYFDLAVKGVNSNRNYKVANKYWALGDFLHSLGAIDNTVKEEKPL